MPGTYRLTVVDPVRQIGDAFVVASEAASVGVGTTAGNGTPTAASGVASVHAEPRAAGPAATADPLPLVGPSPMTVIEDFGSPYRTAIGYLALFSNTGSGPFNTASGYQALYSNTTGSNNLASGYQALFSNTAGSNNTASGVNPLHFNTTGSANTASGSTALASNTTGTYNTASGCCARAQHDGLVQHRQRRGCARFPTRRRLTTRPADRIRFYFSTTGGYNTASGVNALYSNTEGLSNTATV